jgi:sulfur carrier protein ThiS
MVTLTFPFWLVNSHAGKVGKSIPTTLALPPGSWKMLVQQIRAQHPLLAERVFTSSGRIAPGFALVLNDNVVHGDNPTLELGEGDELYIIATIAGG